MWCGCGCWARSSPCSPPRRSTARTCAARATTCGTRATCRSSARPTAGTRTWRRSRAAVTSSRTRAGCGRRRAACPSRSTGSTSPTRSNTSPRTCAAPTSAPTSPVRAPRTLHCSLGDAHGAGGPGRHAILRVTMLRRARRPFLRAARARLPHTAGQHPQGALPLLAAFTPHIGPHSPPLRPPGAGAPAAQPGLLRREGLRPPRAGRLRLPQGHRQGRHQRGLDAARPARVKHDVNEMHDGEAHFAPHGANAEYNCAECTLTRCGTEAGEAHFVPCWDLDLGEA